MVYRKYNTSLRQVLYGALCKRSAEDVEIKNLFSGFYAAHFLRGALKLKKPLLARGFFNFFNVSGGKRQSVKSETRLNPSVCPPVAKRTVFYALFTF